MKSLLASVRGAGGHDRVDHAVQLLEDEWRKHGDVPLTRRWAERQRTIPPDSTDRVLLLAEMVRTDMRCRFTRGQTPTVADYLGQFPELDAADTRVLSLIYEEFCLKEERGDPVDIESFCNHYPRWKESLASQLQYHHFFSRAAGDLPKAPNFPEPGDDFEEFQLLSLLGRGGTARVFLARDLSLGGKRVVLKVSLDRGREPQAQGALDHPHIVPVNSVVFDDRQMRGLSMPYRPGLPLDEVIRRVAPASRPHYALVLWEALNRPSEPKSEDQASTQASPPSPGFAHFPRGDGWEGFPVRGTYAQGAAWVVRIIADALHYAHGQQTFHRDVKPANILLTQQHGPQLLDFNLAESPHSASQVNAAVHGGTLPYMAPEQIEAFFKPELWPQVGARADVYSLGLVLRELLTGQAPDLPAETLSPARAMRVLLDRRPLLDVSVRRANPRIPHALEAIVARCLSVQAERRYPDAGALVEDLDRFLHRRPLLHAINPSVQEKSTNWVVRNRVRVSAVLACLLPIAFLFGLAIGRSHSPDRPVIPIRSSPILQAALKELGKSNSPNAIDPLKQLVELYPESSLPRLFLCLAYDACSRNQEAADRFEEILRIPDHVDELKAWSVDFPDLAERLDKYATKLLDWGVEIKGKRDDLAQGAREQESRRKFALVISAKSLARALRGSTPGSDEIHDFHTALAEEGLSNYDAAFSLATQVLEQIESRLRHLSIITALDDNKKLQSERYQWAWFRGRVATKQADRLRQSGTESDKIQALQYMVVAEKDLEGCRTFVEMFIKKPHPACWVAAIRAPAMLTMAEVEIDLGRLASVASHLNAARHAIETYGTLSGQVEEDVASSRRNVEMNLRTWEDRLNEATVRLEREKAAHSVPAVRSQVSRSPESRNSMSQH